MMSIADFVFSYSNTVNVAGQVIGTHSMNNENNDELSNRKSTNKSVSCNISHISDTSDIQNKLEDYEVGTFIYMLIMLVMSNMLASVLRVFYR